MKKIKSEKNEKLIVNLEAEVMKHVAHFNAHVKNIRHVNRFNFFSYIFATFVSIH